MAPSTPPPTSIRPHTPPTPLHGPRHDSWEPYSPRRSKRSTAQTNPYGSFNAGRSPKLHLQQHTATTPPPTTSKRARFASTQLSSPPSSPSSPMRSASMHTKTPRKTPISSFTSGAHSDSDNHTTTRNLAAPSSAANMFPTPSKTPNKKRSSSTMHGGTARILNFQAHSPNDAMPMPRKMKHTRGPSLDLYEDRARPVYGKRDEIEVYTDSNARVPTLDGAEDNPFIGERKIFTRSKRTSRVRNEEEREMEARAARDEGIVYVFRGKKMFRAFTDNNAQASANDTDADPDDVDYSQRSLRRQAGTSAERPLTRSSILPRLLFETEEQRAERARQLAEDEEATTDIEATTDVDTVPRTSSAPRKASATPKKARTATAAHLATPPSSKRLRRTVDREAESKMESIAEEAEDAELASPAPRKIKAKTRSPFDEWARLKKREQSDMAAEAGVEVVQAGPAKRSGRSGVARAV